MLRASAALDLRRFQAEPLRTALARSRSRSLTPPAGEGPGDSYGIIKPVIFHICSDEDWQRARIAGRYAPQGLPIDGFVHCSDPGTVHLPANHLYAGRGGLVLLQIDPALVDVPVRWEPGVAEDPAGPWFPHIYGPINLAAVVAVHPFRPNAGGRFTPVQPDLIS